MREVLASLKPYYYYLVGEGIKKVEVRKGIPKSNDWDKKVFFYMSKDEKSFAMIPKEYQEKYRRHFGKVGLQFVCDKIQEITYTQIYNFGRYKNVCEAETRLDFYALDDYLKQKNGYGWHISNLKIYDKPKELSEFYPIKPKRVENWTDKDACAFCKYHRWGKTPFEETCLLNKPEPICEYTPPLERPPQSWCYVEENKNER